MHLISQTHPPKQGAHPNLNQGINIGDLADKLKEVNDEEEAAEQKKAEFEAKRKAHYKNEFAMAKLLRQQDRNDDDEDAWIEGTDCSV